MKAIMLTQDQIALVDDEWYDYLSQWKWHAKWSNHAQTFYAAKMICKRPHRKILYMHNVIAYTPLHLQVDHMDHVGTHNWIMNLRWATRSQQMMNRRWQSGTSSQFKGVYWYKALQKWKASIIFNYQHTHLGYFNDEIQAALAYDRAAKELFGEFAYLNFS